MTRCSLRFLMTLAAMAIPATAGAQTPVQSFDQLQHVLKSGQKVVVTETNGHETKGEVLDVSASALAILVSDTRTFSEPAVLKITRTGNHHGLLIGLGIGAAVSVLGLASSRNSERVYFWEFIGVWTFPAAGVVAGAIADHARGDELIYIAPGRAGAGKVTVSPLFAKRAAGMSVSFRF